MDIIYAHDTIHHSAAIHSEQETGNMSQFKLALILSG